MDSKKTPPDQSERDKLQVVVITSAGAYPGQGEDTIPANQKVEVQLKKVARELKIQDTSGWIASVAGRQIDPGKSWADNDLKGHVSVDWGPAIGGGG
jgi:hypothetical protein